MSTKSRKAIPLKEDIVQPTSFDVDKLCDTLNDLTKQFTNAFNHFTNKGAELENTAHEMYDIAGALEDARDNIKDVCTKLENYLD